MQFDDSTSELIHFESHKMTLNQIIILLNNMIIKLKICVWWLKVWLNQKLNFKVQFFFFKFYILMQFKTMKHDAIYLNSSTEALCIC